MLLIRRNPVLALLLVVLVAAGAGVWLMAGAGGEADRRHVVVDGVPLDEVHPPIVPGLRRPAVVIAHGFAGSALLMAQLGDSLAARGHVVVLLDFTGHGANRRHLPDSAASTGASTDALQRDLGTALSHLRGLPDVDPGRVALVGHSMGATAVTRYAVAHPEITATVAMSLPDASTVSPDRPQRLLLLVGGLEFPAFHAEAERAAQGADRSMVVVPGVEHISILYAPRAHREIAVWLGDGSADPAMPSPLRRVCGAAILLLSLLAGLYPLARLLFGEARGSWPRRLPRQVGYLAVLAAAATAVAALLAAVLPSQDLPLALGGYIVGFTATAGVGILGYLRWRGPIFPVSQTRTEAGPLRLAVAAIVLIGYAAAAIAVPLHLGLTHALPVGDRWWLLPLVWAGFALFAYATERVAAGNSIGVLTVSAVAVIALTWAAVVGLTSSFLLLVVPLFAILSLWQAIWSAVLHRFSAPPWLIALVGSLVIAWPIATALPLG